MTDTHTNDASASFAGRILEQQDGATPPWCRAYSPRHLLALGAPTRRPSPCCNPADRLHAARPSDHPRPIRALPRRLAAARRPRPDALGLPPPRVLGAQTPSGRNTRPPCTPQVPRSSSTRTTTPVRTSSRATTLSEHRPRSSATSRKAPAHPVSHNTSHLRTDR